MAYSKEVLDHYENPRNVGTLDKKALDVGTGLEGAPACGDVMRLQIKVDENGGKRSEKQRHRITPCTPTSKNSLLCISRGRYKGSH